LKLTPAKTNVPTIPINSIFFIFYSPFLVIVKIIKYPDNMNNLDIFK